MAKFELKLVEIKEEGYDTKTFRFGLGEAKLDFLPGQFIMTNKMIDGKLIRRAYSISSSPFEKEYIDLTIKRVENGIFSNYMHNLAKTGEVISIDGPYGKFEYKDGENDVVLIGAGCGIAPLMSIARYILKKNLKINIILMHSCKTPNDILFKDEISDMYKNHKNFKYFVTITRPQGHDWNGCMGRINKDILMGVITDLNNPIFFVSGTAAFGHDVVNMLSEVGIGKEMIKEEVY